MYVLLLLLLPLLAAFAVGVGEVAYAEPVLNDPGLEFDVFVSDLCCGVTSMEFVSDDELLVLQKGGKVRLVRDGVLQKEPVLSVETQPIRESGLLGITSVGSTVYIYYTATVPREVERVNRIYSYVWDGERLKDPVLIKELPANLYHNSGVMLTGPDDQVYAVVGDTGRYGPLQNKPLEYLFPPGITDYLDTSVILRVEPEGPYYAVGIRNSFGLAIDPVTGVMWATENGDDDFDEVNMVPDGFNSGWNAIMGPATDEELAGFIGYEDYTYQDPKFSWVRTVAPAAIEFADFADTDAYNDSIFVGDCNNSHLYRFQLNPERDGLVFSSPDLQDAVAGLEDSQDEIITGTGFGCITDMEMGPDGLLYLISHVENTIYRIGPKGSAAFAESTVPAESAVPKGGGGCLVATAAYGTELAPQIQMLREIRDGHLLNTESGAAFMAAFNSAYYSFSPAVADMVREYPAVREAVRALILPMILTLPIMGAADGGTDAEVLALGASVILLNVGIYVAAPVAAAVQVRRQVAGRMRHAS